MAMASVCITAPAGACTGSFSADGGRERRAGASLSSVIAAAKVFAQASGSLWWSSPAGPAGESCAAAPGAVSQDFSHQDRRTQRRCNSHKNIHYQK
ncbi:hypothetical protein PR001_g25124 [Phytophthora rubi]|uniref:Uncharacterized protein n=1 Tax=Phytophthora rubi TaxID=129364 RepID=A0A6A3I6N4_9STRA|nr:hypothetical protein PR001_g25124 [Phytophthora rubi]KAE8980418.1 hypothetical protein PR002_g24136 [Phytophthora rubi]